MLRCLAMIYIKNGGEKMSIFMNILLRYHFCFLRSLFSCSYLIVSNLRLSLMLVCYIFLFELLIWFPMCCFSLSLKLLLFKSWLNIYLFSGIDLILLSVFPRSAYSTLDLINVYFHDKHFIEIEVDYWWFYFGIRNVGLHRSVA